MKWVHTYKHHETLTQKTWNAISIRSWRHQKLSTSLQNKGVESIKRGFIQMAEAHCDRVEAYIAQNEGEMTLKENLELTQTSKTRTDDIMEKGDNNTTLREQEQRGEQLLYEIAVKLSNKGK